MSDTIYFINHNNKLIYLFVRDGSSATENQNFKQTYLCDILSYS